MSSTIRERVLNLLLINTSPLTAVEIQRHLESSAQPIQLSSLSSELKKMYDEGILIRHVGFGPRGGYGYEAKR